MTPTSAPLLNIPTFFIVFIVIAVLIGVIAWVVHHMREKKRSEQMQALARQNGWAYTDRDREKRPKRLRGFTPFGQGHSKYAFNIMTGKKDGVDFELFDYHYATTSRSRKNNSTQHHYVKVCTLVMPIEAPGLTIKREHVGHKLLKSVGAGDISFESDAFTRRYWVRCKDRRFAYDVIDARTMQFLLDNPGWHWEWNGDTLVVHQKGRLKPESAEKLLRTAIAFQKLLPRHLLATGTPASS